jgi:hypothetical protein
VDSTVTIAIPPGREPVDHRRVQRRITEPLAHDHLEGAEVVGQPLVEVEDQRIHPTGHAGGGGSIVEQSDRDRRSIERSDLEAASGRPQGDGTWSTGHVEAPSDLRNQRDQFGPALDHLRRTGLDLLGRRVALVPPPAVVVHAPSSHPATSPDRRHSADRSTNA